MAAFVVNLTHFKLIHKKERNGFLEISIVTDERIEKMQDYRNPQLYLVLIGGNWVDELEITHTLHKISDIILDRYSMSLWLLVYTTKANFLRSEF